MRTYKNLKTKDNNNSNIKFIHFMSHGSLIYNKQIIEMINNEKAFNPKNHLFIVLNKDVYEQNHQYKNVVYDEKVYSNLNEFKKYADRCDFIFLHSYFSNYKMLLLNPRYYNKIVWIEWGHDLYLKKDKKSFIENLLTFPKNIIKSFLKILIDNQQKSFFAIGIGPKYDVIEVKKRYGNKLRILNLPYGYVKNNLKNMDNAIKEYEKSEIVKKDKTIKIMVGHSAYPFINHKEILKKLEKYKNNNILISLVLAYGDKEYAKHLKKFVYKNWPKEKVEIIEKIVDRKEYIKYLRSVDIAIITYKHQSGMGNLYDLLYLGKKIFLNPDGYIQLISVLEGFETYNYNDIDTMDFKAFSQPTKNPEEGIEFAKKICDENYYVKRWKNTIDELEKNINNRRKK